MVKKLSSFSPSRRLVLQGAAAAGVTALGLPGMAMAQSKGRIVVGTAGGDYEHMVTKYIDQAILIPAGWEVVHDVGDDLNRRNKMIAEARLPRGTSDVQGLSALAWYQMGKAGVLAPIDYSQLKNGKYLLPSMKYPFGVASGYTGKVALYNPSRIAAPKSYKEVLDPKNGNKLGLIDIQYQYVMSAAALAAGGKVSDLDGGKKLLLELRKSGARIYPTNEAFAQGLKTEEVTVGIMWKARAVQWKDAGINVQSAVPSEGALKFVLGWSVPKNAPNKAGAYAFLDAALEKSAQEGFATELGFPPTVTNATIPPQLDQRIGFTQEQLAALIDLDYAFLTEHDVELREWWDKSFKG
ncbi:Bacterial extracellular solute-binding protein (plasmid) [Caballeronia sp. SBC1]|uniref:ABC transporter substrate-binding protein n=1 Tax=unclassified Caballeronia TaxID=2646786 RepID=UPI0013E12B92|nr:MULTISPECIES: extracellular solute-binding protein [unclassified Caballeronia]QIE26635.1 Bacterial extracellular solute-binding protein [Caballeronia sp. SBC2]QIN64049.1 Bacterial extracellular solute-binding protein [Caballeronia sp. SBC1]